MRPLVAVGVMVAGVLVAGTAPPARAQQQTRVVAYQRALAQVCQTKVTPEVIRLYQDALKEMETTRYGHGRDSNFFGLRAPERAYNDCFQGTGVMPR
jgi:hypothetical protein